MTNTPTDTPTASTDQPEFDAIDPPVIPGDGAAPSPAYGGDSGPAGTDAKPSFSDWIAKAEDGLEHGHAGFDNTNPDQSGYDSLTGTGLDTDRESSLNAEDPDQSHYDPITGSSAGLGE